MPTGVYKRTEAHLKIRRAIGLKLRGRNNPTWKGKDACYSAFHHWIKRFHGKPIKCVNPDCVYPRKNSAGGWILKPKRYEWALIHGRKYSHNVNDYMQLCASCHRTYDTHGELRKPPTTHWEVYENSRKGAGRRRNFRPLKS